MLISNDLIKALKRCQAELAEYEEPTRNSKSEIENIKFDAAQIEAELLESGALLDSVSRKMSKIRRRMKFAVYNFKTAETAQRLSDRQRAKLVKTEEAPLFV